MNQELANLALFEQQQGVTVEKRWIGEKYLELLSFPVGTTGSAALAIISNFQAKTTIEKVVTVSAMNLGFKAGDFANEYSQGEIIPEDVKRGVRESVSVSDVPPLSVPHVPNEIIVRWKNEVGTKAEYELTEARRSAFNAALGVEVVSTIYQEPFGQAMISVTQLLRLPAPLTVDGAFALYNASDLVTLAQPNYIYTTDAVPNDTIYPSQWSLPRISAPDAWNITTGQQSLIIAVGDTGANRNHPDIAPNFFAGYNFINNTTNVTDDHRNPQTGQFVYHGSHVSSIVGAKGNNGQYMTGVAWNTSLLILKLSNASGSTPRGADCTTDILCRGIDYAYGAGHKARVLNLSLGTRASAGVDDILLKAVRRARANGLVVVAAAGNENVNSDSSDKLVMPASLSPDNLIAIGATERDDSRTGFSNFGQYRVELGAPGRDILGLKQTFSGSSNSASYNTYSGTSQAAPHVTGTLALVASKYQEENYRGIIDRVLMGVDDVGAISPTSPTGGFRTGGRLNASKALQKRTIIRNLSTRGKVESGDRIMIGGFIIGGYNPSGTLKVAIRGIGPSLPTLGVPRLNNPRLTLRNMAGQVIFSNDDWNNLPQDQKNDLGGLTPSDTREAAMVQTLAPGGYTVFLESQDGQQGVGLFEIYELERGANEQTRLLNVSTRCPVGTGDEVAIAGIIIGEDPGNPNAEVPKRRILMTGKGPSLAQAGVPGPLSNPNISLHASTGAVITSNNQWRDVDQTSTGLEEKIAEAGFAPQCPNNPSLCENESILWPTLRQSSYTTILSGVGGDTGIGLVEFYEY